MENTALPAPSSFAAFCFSILNSIQDSGTTPGNWTTLTFGSDVTISLGTAIDRPTTSRFRALRAAYYKVTYKMVAYPDTLPVLNDTRGMQFRVFKNGTTELTGSSTRGNSGAANDSRGGTTCSFSGIYLLAVNDYIEIQVNPIDSGQIHVLSESSCMFELVKLT